MNSSEELVTKYQRLGQEYQKARAQITVLKKAVLDEQAANKVLQDAIKVKDQDVRKYEQEVDSLQFRNSQLSKRVEILQSELDEYERKGVKPSKHSNQQTSISFIHQQELQMKIAENESLHKQLQEAHDQHGSNIHHLESRLEVLEQNNHTYEKQLEDCNNKNNAIVDRMKKEQVMLNAKLHKQEEDLKFAKIMSDKYQQQLKEAHQELRSKLDKTTKLMQEKVPFIDTENQNLNKLNVPVCDRKHQHTAQAFIEKLTGQFIAFMAGLSDYHTYLEQRLKVYSVDIKQEQMSDINAKFCSHLLQNATYSRKVQHSLKTLQDEAKKEVFVSLSTLPSLNDVVSAFKSFVKYMEKLMPYRKISINEECRSSMWTESLEKHNYHLLSEEKKLTSCFQSLSTYIALVANPDLPTSSMGKCIENISTVLSKISLIFQTLHEQYKEKSEEEHNLPVYTDRLKTTDECLLSTVHTLSGTASKLKNTFQENLEFMSSSHGFKRIGLPTETKQVLSKPLKDFFHQAAGYMSQIQQEAPTPSVPYSLAVRNYRSLMTTADSSETLKQQAVSSQETIVRLEQEKEHWMMEAQLLKAKYEKELQKTALLGEEVKKCKTESLQLTIDENMSTTRKDSPNENNSRLIRTYSSASTVTEASFHQVPFGTMESQDKMQQSCMESDHEKLLKDHLSNRIAQLTKQLQLVDSKCINFYHEAHTLYKQLVLADKNKQKFTKELLESNKKVENLQDELETTKRSYEEQLRTLSDHLCGMNEKLTSQKDEIDELKTTGGAGGGSSMQKFISTAHNEESMASKRRANDKMKVKPTNAAEKYNQYLQAFLEIAPIEWNTENTSTDKQNQDATKDCKQRKMSEKAMTSIIPRQHQCSSRENSSCIKKTSENTSKGTEDSNNSKTKEKIEQQPSSSRDPDTMPTFYDITDEIILKIFVHLPRLTIVNCVCVCRRWRSLGYDKLLWKQVNLDSRKFREKGVLGLILHRGVEILRLSKAEVLAPVFFDELEMSRITMVNTWQDDDNDEDDDNLTLTHLDCSMSKFSGDGLSDMLYKCERLQNLSLEGCRVDQSVVSAITMNKNVEVLNLALTVGLSCSSVDILTRNCKKLTSVNLSWCNQTRDCIRYLIRCKNLTSLNLAGLRGGINRVFMETLVTNLKKMKELDFSDVTLQVGSLKLIADHLKFLEKLSISRCTDVRSEQLLDLQSLRSLSHLNLFGFLNSAALDQFSDCRPDIHINKGHLSPIARPIISTTYEGRLWEQYVGFII